MMIVAAVTTTATTTAKLGQQALPSKHHTILAIGKGIKSPPLIVAVIATARTMIITVVATTATTIAKQG